MKPPETINRLVYFGTPEASVAPLRALCEAGFDVAMAVTAPPKRRGRRGSPSPTPVEEAARALGVPVRHNPESALDVKADLGVVVAYGQLIRAHVLAKVPMVNLHFSLLPRWRGAAPLERAILAGDETTGVCLMELEETLDTGGVYASAEVPIGDASLSELCSKLTDLGSSLLIGALADGLGTPTPQQGEVSWAKKITPEDLRLDWTLPAQHLLRRVRLERAWTTFRGRRLLILGAAPAPAEGLEPGEMSGALIGTGDGGLRLLEVKPEGRRTMTAAEWLRGARVEDGHILGN